MAKKTTIASMMALPSFDLDLPDRNLLEWHNNYVYLGCYI